MSHWIVVIILYFVCNTAWTFLMRLSPINRAEMNWKEILTGILWGIPVTLWEVAQVLREDIKRNRKLSGHDWLRLMFSSLVVVIAITLLYQRATRPEQNQSPTIHEKHSGDNGSYMEVEIDRRTGKVVEFVFVIPKPGDYILYYQSCPGEDGQAVGSVGFLEFRPDKTYAVRTTPPDTVLYNQSDVVRVPLTAKETYSGQLGPSDTAVKVRTSGNPGQWCGVAAIRLVTDVKVLQDKKAAGVV